MTPNGTRRFADAMLSPGRYVQRKFRPGGINGSMFSLIAATLGAGTITFPYAIWRNGIIWGAILVIVGALVSFYTGMLIVTCANVTKKNRYEDIAMTLYGPKMYKASGIMNIICLGGFGITYIVFVANTFPHILSILADGHLSPFITSYWGIRMWGTIFAFGVIFPLSIPR